MTYGIYYFSGTGNSLYSAKRIAESLGDSQLMAISKEIKEENIVVKASTCILVFPSYAYQLPMMVKKFIKKATFESDRIIAIVTYGSSYGGTLGEVKRLLKRKKKKLSYAVGIRCVENYLPVFGSPKPSVKKKRLEEQKEKTEMIVSEIRRNTENSVAGFRPLSIFVSSLFRLFSPLLVKLNKIHPECNACGICASICPAEAIEIKNKKDRKIPVFNSKKCEHCQACYNYCPKGALSLLRLKKGNEKYHHPEVKINDLK